MSASQSSLVSAEAREIARQRSRDWYYQNKERAKANSKAYQQANRKAYAAKAAKYRVQQPEKHKEARKRYNDANRDRIAQQTAARRAANLETFREKGRQSSLRSAKRNRGRLAAIKARRRADQLMATPPWADLNKIKEFYVEAARLTRETGIPHEVDHIYPLRHKLCCGLHVHWNLQILTRTENRSKGNKLPFS